MPDQTHPHLWEIDHPYYCNEGNYYASGDALYEVHSSYASWADFYEDWGTTDPDLNLVFRWDWQRADPADLIDGEEPGPDILKVFWVLQRKAILRSTECVVTEEDEPAVRAWLADRARTIAAIWEPISLTLARCDCGKPIPGDRKAYCSDRCKREDDNHGPDTEPAGGDES